MIDNVAVQITIDNKIFSYAQKRVVLAIEDSNRFVNIAFLPFLIDVENPEYEFELGEQPPVPTIRVTLWDPEREIFKEIDKSNYEAFSIKLFFVNKQDVVEYVVNSYMTDHSYSESKLSFTVRMDEESFAEVYSEHFKSDTFQSFEIFSPRNVNLEPSMVIENDSPWSVFRSVNRGSAVAAQNGIAELVPERNRAPLGGIQGGGRCTVIRLSKSPSRLGGKPIYHDYLQQQVVMLKVNVVLPNTSYTLFVGATAYSINSGSSPTALSIIQAMAAAFNVVTAGIATVLEETEILYIFASPSFLSLGGSLSSGTMQLYFDEATIGTASTLRTTESNIFSATMGNEIPTQYHVGLIGDPNNPDKIERFAYLFLTKNRYWYPLGGPNGQWFNIPGDHWFLSGIPSKYVFDPLSYITNGNFNFSTIQSFDPSVTSAQILFNKYGIESPHAKGEDVRDIANLDSLLINTNGLNASSLDDPQLSVGFITLLDSFTNPVNNIDYYSYYRYKIRLIYRDIFDELSDNASVVDTVLVVDIYPVAPAIQPVSVNHYPFVATRFWLPRTLEPAAPAKLVNFEFVVASIDLNITNLPISVYERIATSFPNTSEIVVDDSNLNNRWKGSRLDMISNSFDFRISLGRSADLSSSGTESENFTEENARLINNSNGKFAICTSSSIISKHIGPNVKDYDIFERMEFFIVPNNNSWSRLFTQQIDSSPDADFNTDAVAAGSRRLSTDSPLALNYVNYLTYKPNQRNIPATLNNYEAFAAEAKGFFASSAYRIINDPVPENSQDLGKIFPIVYGNVIDVPLIHIISNKHMGKAGISAGDDSYVFASHPVNIKTPADIRLTIIDREDEATVKDKELFSNNLKDDLIQKPFPNVIDGHYETIPPLPGRAGEILNYVGELAYPYHDLRTFKSNNDSTFYGVQLQGALWNPRVGKLDKRYPIRNGIGSSTLYGSFSGWPDVDGVITGRGGTLLEHPLDIIAHLMTYYSKQIDAANLIDLVNIKDVKSVTRDYKASIYITEELNIGELISELCAQFGIVYSFYNGKLRFSILDDSNPDLEKVISDDYNLLHGSKEISNTYKDIFSDITYRYNYSFFSDNFASEVVLNELNNQYCARAARNRGPSKSFEIDAKYVRWVSTAREVAFRYSKYLARRRYEYEISVRPQPHQSFAPGDCLPLWSKELAIQGIPVIVSSVQEGRDTVRLKVLHYVE